ADIPAVNAALNEMAKGKPQLNQNLGEQAANVQRSIHLQAVALWIVSGLVALIGLLVLSQLLARQATIDATASPTLSALGMARSAALPGLPAPVSTGMRLALEPGRGATEVPVRSSLMSVILAIVALAGALTFGAGLDHLLETPRAYGWNWDAHLTTSGENQTT